MRLINRNRDSHHRAGGEIEVQILLHPPVEEAVLGDARRIPIELLLAVGSVGKLLHDLTNLGFRQREVYPRNVSEPPVDKQRLVLDEERVLEWATDDRPEPLRRRHARAALRCDRELERRPLLHLATPLAHLGVSHAPRRMLQVHEAVFADAHVKRAGLEEELVGQERHLLDPRFEAHT